MPQVADAEAAHDALTGDLVLAFAGLPDRRLRLRSWTRGLLLEADEGDGWLPEPLDPGAFLRASSARSPEGPIAAFVREIPSGVLELAAAAGPYELTALRLLRVGAAATELAASAPNLFALLCLAMGVGELDLAAGVDLVAAPRATILHRCAGLSGGGGTLRALESLRFERFGVEERRVVVEALSSETILRLLRRRPFTRVTTARRLLRFRGWNEARWLPELSTTSDQGLDQFGVARKLTEDCEALAAALRIPDGRQAIARAASVAALQALHDRWDARHRRELLAVVMLQDERGPVPLPDSGIVFPEDPRFRVLRTIGAVRAEGLTMQHCAASYLERCEQGVCVLVHVVDPPATLEVRVRDGRAFVVQLKGPRNSEVTAECASAAAEWIARARVERV